MSSAHTRMDISIKQKFSAYPEEIALILNQIRALIFTVAKQEGITDLVETLKWGEPSYLSPAGSTIRFDWKPKHPQQYCVYFNCKTCLIETFKEIYGNTFNYEGNRALVFKVGKSLPSEALGHCIAMSLRYKTINHLPLLGA